MKNSFILAVVFGLSACSGGEQASDSASQTAGTTADVASSNSAPAAWNQCAICHKAEKGAPNGLGPNLHGIVGRKAGIVEGFSYSPAMKAAGFIWDDAALDAFLAKPQAKVPGTRMSYAGQSDKAKRDEIINWLKLQK
jgi:cytochrome c